MFCDRTPIGPVPSHLQAIPGDYRRRRSLLRTTSYSGTYTRLRSLWTGTPRGSRSRGLVPCNITHEPTYNQASIRGAETSYSNKPLASTMALKILEEYLARSYVCVRRVKLEAVFGSNKLCVKRTVVWLWGSTPTNNSVECVHWLKHWTVATPPSSESRSEIKVVHFCAIPSKDFRTSVL